MLRKLINGVLIAVATFLICNPARADDLTITHLFNTATTPRSATPGASSHSVSLNVNRAEAARLSHGSKSVQILNLPTINGDTENFIVHPFRVFADGGDVVTIKSDGTTESLAPPQITAYSGHGISNSSRSLFLSVNSVGDIHAIISGDPSTTDTTILPITRGTGAHVLSVADKFQGPFCTALTCPSPTTPQPIKTSAIAPRDTNPREVKVVFDASYIVYQNLDSDADTVADYMTNLIGAVSSIYQRDLNTYITIQRIYVWETQDPIESGSASGELYSYQSYCKTNRPDEGQDLNHYVGGLNIGGAAFLNGLTGGIFGDEYYGVSNIFCNIVFPVNLNSYYWDIECISHELGHNLGSPHTHCYSPPIDCCYINEPCTTCTVAIPIQDGTIMSYCHLLSGAHTNLIFHPRCIDRMRPFIEGAPVDVYIPQPDIRVLGGTKPTIILPGNLTPGEAAGTNLGDLPINSGSASTQFTIFNAGDQPLNLTGVPVVSISGSSQFTVSQQPSSTTLNPGESTQFEITMSSNNIGTFHSQIAINSDDPNLPIYSFAIQGKVYAASAPQDFTFNGNTPIVDSGPPIFLEFNPANLLGPVRRITLTIGGQDCALNDDAKVGIEHHSVGDLVMILTSPSGTECYIMFNLTSTATGPNFCGTVIEDSATISINDITPTGGPYTGSYKPLDPFSDFIGEDGNGTWKLQIADLDSNSIGGAVHSVTLSIVTDLPPASVKDEWTLYN